MSFLRGLQRDSSQNDDAARPLVEFVQDRDALMQTDLVRYQKQAKNYKMLTILLTLGVIALEIGFIYLLINGLAGEKAIDDANHLEPSAVPDSVRAKIGAGVAGTIATFFAGAGAVKCTYGKYKQANSSALLCETNISLNARPNLEVVVRRDNRQANSYGATPRNV